jgi:hypothetical protein
MSNRKILSIVFNGLMIMAATVSTVMLGIVGYGRPSGPEHIPLYDYIFFFYVAGKTWLNGLNPYDAFFPYPPNSSLLFTLLSVVDLESSKLLFLILNVVCILVFAYLGLRLYNYPNGEKPFFLFDFKSSLLVAMIIGNIAVANVLWAGQTSILFSTALLASYFYHIRSHDIRSGIFLAIALIKPQLAYTFLLWMVLEKRWKTLAVSIIATIILGIVPIYQRGIITSVLDWMGVLNHYVQGENATFWNLFGLLPLLHDLGIHINSKITLIASMVLVILIHRYDVDIDRSKLLGILAIIGLLLGQAHQYDLIIAASILPYYFKNIDISKKDFKYLAFICFTFVVINFPRKLSLLSDMRILHHHRELIFITLLFFLLIRQPEKNLAER